MLLMAEAKPRWSNRRSEGFFFCGRGQYTIFLHSRSERAFRLAPQPVSWHFLAVVQIKGIVIFLITFAEINKYFYLGNEGYITIFQ